MGMVATPSSSESDDLSCDFKSQSSNDADAVYTSSSKASNSFKALNFFGSRLGCVYI